MLYWWVSARKTLELRLSRTKPSISSWCCMVTSCVQVPSAALDYGQLMMTLSNGNIFRVTGPLCGEFNGPGEFPTQRPVTLSFDVFFDLRLNKRLSKQPWGWWFETPSWSLWRQCNVIPKTTHTQYNSYPTQLVLEYELSWLLIVLGTSCLGYKLSWVRVVQIPVALISLV